MKPKPRKLRARQPVAVAALAISTENCLAIGGLMPHKLRALLEKHADVPRARVGHTLLIEPAHFYELLERERVGADGIDLAHEDLDDETPDSVDGVLRKLGKERVA